MKRGFVFLAVLTGLSFAVPEEPTVSSSVLKDSGNEQLESLRSNPATQQWANAFSLLLKKREQLPFFKRLDTMRSQCLWLIETFDLRDSSYTATELHYRDTVHDRYFHDRTGTDTSGHLLVYEVYHAPILSRLGNSYMDDSFRKDAKPFKTIANKSCWSFRDTILLINHYQAGTRKPSRKKKEAWRQEIRANLANTIVLYTMISPGDIHTSVQLPPAKMPYINLHVSRIYVCF